LTIKEAFNQKLAGKWLFFLCAYIFPPFSTFKKFHILQHNFLILLRKSACYKAVGKAIEKIGKTFIRKLLLSQENFADFKKFNF